MKNFDLTKVTDVEICGVYGIDYPKFTDAYIDAAKYDGEQMSNEDIADLELQHPEFVNDQANEYYANYEPEY